MSRSGPALQRLFLQSLGGLILVTLTVRGLGAQARPDSAAARLDSVVVRAGRSPTAVGGASALIVSPSTLAYPSAPTPSLSDILRQVPFILIRQNSRGENEISVRGSDSRQAAVLVDGIPITLGWDSRLDPSLVPLTGVRQLTVTRGLSSVLGGPNVLGGMIEFGFTGARGTDTDGRRDLRVATGVDAYGGYAASVAGGTRTGTGVGRLTVRGGVSQRARDGFALSRNGGEGDGASGGTPDPGRDGRGRLRTNSDLHELDAFAALRLEGSSGRHLGLTVTGFEADRGVPGELHIESPRLWRYPDVSRRLAILSAGTGPARTPFGTGSLTASGGISTGSLVVETYSNPTFVSVSAREYGDERTLTARVLGTHSLFDRGTMRASYTRSQVRYDEQFNDDAATRYVQSLSSAGLETEWSVAGTAQVSAGLVRDQMETPESGGREPLPRTAKSGWRVGASTLSFASAVRLHASVSQRSRFPALRELYSGALNRFDPNPDLKPETLLGAELGATILGGPVAAAGFTIQAVAFQHRLDDAVIRITLPDRKFRRINRDEIRSSGLELVADWTSNGTVTTDPARAVTVIADLLVQRVRVHDQTLAAGTPRERRAEHVPELRGALHLGVPLVVGLRAAGAMRMTGKQYCQHPDLGELVELGSQTVADLALTREWTTGTARLGSVRAILAMDNLSDATVYDQCGLPQPGRTVRVGVELR